MKNLILLFLLSCTTAPAVKNLTYKQTITHDECLLPLKRISLSVPQKIQSAVLQTTGTTGSLLLTSVGMASDTVIVSTGLFTTIYLCGQNGNSSGCGELFGGYMGLMENLDALWTTKKAYNGTAGWRCPYVDHISRAFRKVSSCLHENGEFVAAFEQLNILTNDPVMNECMSQTELKRVEELNKSLSQI